MHAKLITSGILVIRNVIERAHSAAQCHSPLPVSAPARRLACVPSISQLEHKSTQPNCARHGRLSSSTVTHHFSSWHTTVDDDFNGKLLLLPPTLQTFSIRVRSETEIKQKTFLKLNFNQWNFVDFPPELPFVYYGRVRSTSLPNVRRLLVLRRFLKSQLTTGQQMQVELTVTARTENILWLWNIYACSLCFVLQCLVAWVRFSWVALSVLSVFSAPRNSQA